MFVFPLAAANATRILEFITWGGLIAWAAGLLVCLLMMVIAGWPANTTD